MRKRKALKLGAGAIQVVMSGSQDDATNRKGKEKVVNEANSLTPTEFKKFYIEDEALNYSANVNGVLQAFHIDFVTSSQLTNNELEECYLLINSTSRPDYEASSFGWHPKRKKREMREEEMRYLLVRSISNPLQPDISARGPVLGFLSFMLTHDSIPCVPVLYVYEIHLQERLRKVGLGAHLMDVAEGIAEQVGVSKVMLTCFLSNEKARGFYQRREYGVDVSSPEDRTMRCKNVKADYLIMSKVVQKTEVVEAICDKTHAKDKDSND